MLDHVSIGVRDIGRTRGFYDAVFAPLGYRCLSAGETSLGYGKDSVVFWIGASEAPVATPRTSRRPSAATPNLAPCASALVVNRAEASARAATPFNIPFMSPPEKPG